MTHSDDSSWLTARIITFEPAVQQQLTTFVRRHFAPEDDALQWVRAQIALQGLPEAQIRPEEGQMLRFLATLTGARRVLEVGTHAGYSGIWLARALPEDGHLITLERDAKRAAMARAHFERAGVASRITIVEGDALTSLAALALDAPFDMVFVDMDKDAYPALLDWALDHVRPGGLITAHNAFREGELLADHPSEGTLALRTMLDRMANHPRLMATIIPVGDGIAAAVVR